MSNARNVFLTDLRGFANPVIAEKLRSAGARVIACDPAIKTDGEENKIEVIEWDSPAALVGTGSWNANVVHFKRDSQ